MKLFTVLLVSLLWLGSCFATGQDDKSTRRSLGDKAYAQALQLFARGELPEAEVVARAAANYYYGSDKDPHSAKVLLSEILLEGGSFEKARKELMEAPWQLAHSAKEDVLMGLLNARLHLLPGDNQDVLWLAIGRQKAELESEIGSLANLPPDPYKGGALATSLILFSRIDGRSPRLAQATLREALQISPNNAAAAYLLGKRLVEEHKLEEAKPLLELAAKFGKGSLPEKARRLSGA